MRDGAGRRLHCNARERRHYTVVCARVCECVSTVRKRSIIAVVSQKRSACEWLAQQRVKPRLEPRGLQRPKPDDVNLVSFGVGQQASPNYFQETQHALISRISLSFGNRIIFQRWQRWIILFRPFYILFYYFHVGMQLIVTRAVSFIHELTLRHSVRTYTLAHKRTLAFDSHAAFNYWHNYY